MVAIPKTMGDNIVTKSSKMTKRKITWDDSGPKTKQICTDNAGNDNEDEDVFNVTRFMALVNKREGSEALLESLRIFVSYAEMYPNAPDNVDIVLDFCEISDDGKEILALLRILRIRPPMISAIFNVLQCILIRVADNLAAYKKLANSIAQRLLNTHMKQIYDMLEDLRKSKPVKSALKLLTAIVVLGENSARNVLNKFDFTKTELIRNLLERRNMLDEQDVRSCFIIFLSSFLMAGSDAIIQDFVCKPNVLANVFAGLRVDKCATISLILPLIQEKVVKNELMTKSEKVKVFSADVLTHLARVYNWLGPKTWKLMRQKKDLEFQEIEKTPALESVRSIVHSLLLDLCTSPKHGIIFFDKTFGTSGRDPNHTMRLFLQNVHVMPYLEDVYLKELVLKIFQVCPEQMQPFLMQIQNSTTPRPTPGWLRCMDFLENILEILPDLPLPLKTSRKIPVKELLDLVQSVVLPPQEILQPIITSIGFTNVCIRHRCLQYTLKLMKKLEFIIEYCTNGTFQSESKVFTKADVEIFTALFMAHLKRALPSMKTFFYCWQEMNKDKTETQLSDSQNIQDLPEVDLVEHVILIEQILCLCQRLQPEAFSDFPVIEKIFEHVQKMYQSLKLQQSSTTLLPAESDKVSGQQIRAGLYLLQLLASTDARKIPWNMKNADGQPLIYFLFEILLSTNSDHHLLSITKQLICQLLFQSSLFDSNEMELHLWIDTLIKCSVEENSERNEALLKFVASVFTHYICNPHPYIEKIFEVISEASLLEIDADTKSDVMSTSTVDDFIDRLDALDGEDLEFIVQPTEEMEGRQSLKLSFSPLIIVAIKETAQKSDDEIKPLKNYLRSVVLDLFNSQNKPIPLGFLLTEERKRNKKHAWISKGIVSYVKSWLPNCEQTRNEKSLDVEEYQNERPSVLLQLFHQNGRSLIDDSGFTTLLFKSVNQLNVSETLRAAQQSLLYIEARLYQIEQAGNYEDKELLVLQLIFKYLKKVVKHLFQRCQEQIQPNTSFAEKGCEDLAILQIKTYTVARMLSEVLNFVSQQNAIQNWFLAITPGVVKNSAALKGDKFKLLRNLVTKELTSVFTEFPKTSNKHLLSSYCTKVIAYLKECLVSVSKSRVLDDLAFTVLKHFIPYVDFISIQQSVQFMLQIPTDLLLSSTTSAGQTLLKLLNYLIQNCKTFQLEEISLRNLYTLLLRSQSLDRLVTICKTLFEAKPYYCLSCTSDVFVHLLNSASPEHLDLAVILMTYNVTLDQVFVEWVLDNNLKKQNLQKFLKLCITWCKCQKKLPTDKSKKCLGKISKASCKYISTWMTENDPEPTDSFSECLQLLHLFARLQASGYKRMSGLDSFKEMVDSNQTMSHSKLKIFLALIQWAESINDQSVDATRYRIEACMKTFLSSIQARAGAPEDKELESQLLGYLEKYLIDLPPKYDDLILSNWMSFIRNSLRIYYSDCRVLRLVNHLIPKVYAESSGATISPSLKELHQMLIGHSNFLPVILGNESPVSKELLVDILLMIVERQPDCCSEGHLYVLMGAYGATLSTCDQKLLKIIHLYEKNGIDFAKFRPFVWGFKVIEMYELTKLEPTLKLPSTDRIFELIDAEKMLKSILHFPVKRKLIPLEVAPAEQWKSLDCCYDPCFLLPVLSHLLAPYNKLRSLHFIMKNCLGYTLASLSSHDPNMRAAAYHILIRLEEQLKGSLFHRKDQYLYLLQYLRNSLPDENMKLPFVTAIYMMRICQILLNEGHILYPALTAPLMVKPCMQTNLISEFFRLFSSSSLQHYHERMWILYLLHDGLKESNDYNIYKKYYIFKIIMSFANSVLCNYSSQFQILRILKRACKQKTGAYDLTRHCGIVSWMNNFISNVDPHSPIIVLVTDVIHTLWFSLLRKNSDCANSNSFGLPLPFLQEMQVVLLNLLQSYREGTSFSAMKYFLPLFASVLHCKKQLQAQQKGDTLKEQLDLKNDKPNDSDSEDEDDEEKEMMDETETALKNKTDNNLATCRVQLQLTPRDVLLVIYQSRSHSSNIQLSERSLDLMKRWGYSCDHLTEVSHSLPKEIAKKPGYETTDISDVCQDEDSVESSENDEKKLQQSLVDICLEWIPSRTFQPATKECGACFDETLELVMACLCEEAARTVSPSSIVNILHWIETHLKSWNFTAVNVTQNTSQGDIPLLYTSILSLYTRLLNMNDTEQSSNGTNFETDAISQKSVKDAVYLLRKVCRTLAERWNFCEVSLSGETNVSSVLVPYLQQIAIN